MEDPCKECQNDFESDACEKCLYYEALKDFKELD